MEDTITRDHTLLHAGAVAPANVQCSTDFAWLGEGADGFRGKQLALVVDEKRDLVLLTLAEEGPARDKQLKGKQLVAEVMTVQHLPGRKKVTNVTCHGDDFEDAQLPSDRAYDAVFWTESSVEKFLYPYYHSHRLWSGQLDDLKREFEEDVDAVAIAHRAPSTSSTVKVPAVDVGVLQGGELKWMSITDYIEMRTT